MTRNTPATVLPEDVRATASACRRVLQPVADADWDRLAEELEWSCRTTLAHVLSGLLYYAINLATRSTELRFSGQTEPSLPVPELLDALEGRAAVLAEVCAAAPRGARGAHDWGMPDASGFAALACDEMLLHTSNIALALGASFDLSPDVCVRVLERPRSSGIVGASAPTLPHIPWSETRPQPRGSRGDVTERRRSAASR